MKRLLMDAVAKRFHRAYWSQAKPLLRLDVPEGTSLAEAVLAIHERAMDHGAQVAFGGHWQELPPATRAGIEAAHMKAISTITAIPLSTLSEIRRGKTEGEERHGALARVHVASDGHTPR
jgi:hypothetical protein